MVDAVIVVGDDGTIAVASAGAAELTGYTCTELRGLPITTLVIDGRDLCPAGSTAEGRCGSIDGRDLCPAGSTAEGRCGSIDGRDLCPAPAPTTAEGRCRFHRRLRRHQARRAHPGGDHQLTGARRRWGPNDGAGRARRPRAGATTCREGRGHRAARSITHATDARRAARNARDAGGRRRLRAAQHLAQIEVAAVDELIAALATGDDLAIALKQILPDLERVGEHITQHGTRLLQLAAPGPDHVAPIDLNDVVRDVVSTLTLAGKLRRIELELALPRDPLIVTVNRTRIEQVLVNLLINAVESITGEGTVEIDVRPSADPTRISCAIRDTGTGIPTDVVDKIFEPFFTTKGEHGTDLGLPVVKEIVAKLRRTAPRRDGGGRRHHLHLRSAEVILLPAVPAPRPRLPVL